MHLGYHELRNMLQKFKEEREQRKLAPPPSSSQEAQSQPPPAGGSLRSRIGDKEPPRSGPRGSQGYRDTSDRVRGDASKDEREGSSGSARKRLSSGECLIRWGDQ